MKKAIVILLLAALCCLPALSLADGVTLRTLTPFADMDFAAQPFMDLVTEWEGETGNFVEDYSGAMDQAWHEQMIELVKAGEADIVVVPLGSGLTAQELVTAQELAQAAPQLGVRVFSSMAERDGSVLLTPVRLNWSAVYVNTSVLAAAGVEVPTTFEELVTACSMLSSRGVKPFANALGDWAEIVLECAAAAGAPGAVFGSEESLQGAQDVLTTLTLVGAFGEDVLGSADVQEMVVFASGGAAMRIDSDYYAYDISQGDMDRMIVIPMPAPAGMQSGVLAGSPGIGLAITRSCFADDERREAALSLAAKILAEDALITPATGALGGSIVTMTRSAADCTGLLYDTMPDRFDSWASGVVNSLGNLR